MATLGGTAIVRWTGRGRVESLEASIAYLLRDRRVPAKIWRTGGSITIEGPEPTAVARMFKHMPGVAWVAAGGSAESTSELGRVAARLARTYLRGGKRFWVSAEASGGAVPADVAGVIISAALGAASGARVDESSPSVILRGASDGGRGAVGVEIERGPGGVPTGSKNAKCLVSGGKHSSVVAWMALLSGFAVRLVHSVQSEESLRAVARLYAELSNRVDYTKLSLEVFEGVGATRHLVEKVRKNEGNVFGGFHPGCSAPPSSLAGRVKAPLHLLTEEDFDIKFGGLSLLEDGAKQDWRARGSGSPRRRTFGGIRADVSGILDGLR